MRQDILKTYRALHTWVGIVAALFLFIGFYAGAVTMFKEPLRHWSSTATKLPPALALEDTPELIRRALQAHPEASRSFTVHMETTPANPARLTWSIRDANADNHHAEPRTFGAGFDAAGALVVGELHPAPVAQFIDTLHRQLGLPFEHEIAMPFTAALALLYFLALVSGVVVLLPTLVRTLFLIRAGGRSVRRMWLDVHNTLGFLSLPFHLVIALTVVVFALHDEFYALQDKVLFGGRIAAATSAVRSVASPAAEAAPEARPVLAPLELRARLAEQAPGFRLQRIEYFRTPAGEAVRVFGADDRHILRGPVFGIGIVDAHTGELRSTDYFPGRQPTLLAAVTAFFALHFGNYGGTPIRWAYVALGLSGAFLFYTGNLLWIEARRKRMTEGSDLLVVQTRSTRWLAALTVGVCHGTMAGISLTVAAARWLPASAHLGRWHEAIFYAVFALALGWAFRRGAARAGYELLWFCAACTAAIPLGSVTAVLGVGHPYTGPLAVDATALAATVVFAGLARLARRRARTGPKDSVWAVAG